METMRVKTSRASALLGSMMAAALALGGCEGGANFIERDQLYRSHATWTTVKGNDGRSYRYTDRDSSFTGFSWETTIEVHGATVVSRAYTRKDMAGAVAETWTEDASALGSHAAGAPPLTIDEIYDRCASTVLAKDPAANLITLTFHDDGVLDTCTYFPKNCADDCAVGYRISSYQLLN